MDQSIKVACDVVVTKGDSILFGLRKNSFGAGSWALPGGHLEYGEKTIDCAKRELFEETGIKDAKLTFSLVTDGVRPDQHYVHIVFKLENFNGAVQNIEPDKCEEWKFFPRTALPENIFVSHQGILKTYLEKIHYLEK